MPVKLTLALMESAAKGEADACCSVRVDGQWLEVQWRGDDAEPEFNYYYSCAPCTRDEAAGYLR